MNELLTFVDRENIHYWRDKAKNELDFVIKLRGKAPLAIECKWRAAELNWSASGRRWPEILRMCRRARSKQRTFGEFRQKGLQGKHLHAAIELRPYSQEYAVGPREALLFEKLVEGLAEFPFPGAR